VHLLVLVAESAFLGLGLGTWVVRARGTERRVELVLEPGVIDLTGERRSDRDLLRAEFTLRNPSKDAITITAITPSCTCTTALPAGQQEPPFELAPGAETTIGLVTNLASRYGPQSYTLSVAASAGDRPLPTVEGRVDVVVDSPLLPHPPRLDVGRVARGKAVTRSVVLADTLESSETRVAVVSTSDETVLSATVRPVDDVLERGRGYRLQGRYAVDVTIEAGGPDARRHELVRIQLDDGRELSLPVSWTVDQAVQVSPRRIFITGVPPRQRVERDVFVTLADERPSAPRVVEAGDGVETRIEPFGPNRWRLRIAFTAPSPGDEPWSNVVLAAGQDGRAAVIPILVRADD
jgi:hypothetical protein